MRTHSLLVVLGALSSAALAACGGDAGDRSGSDAAVPPAEAAQGVAADFTAADVDAFVRGLERETALVREAQARARAAATPAERGEAMQAQWKEQTMAGGAEAAGMPVDRYAAIRDAITGTLQTLDFQGKIDGPMQLDTSRATPEMRRQLEADAYEGLPAASASALRARLDQVVPVWAAYVELTAVGG